MSKESILQSNKIGTINELIRELEIFKTKSENYILLGGDAIDYLQIHLVEETLTDGSKVHDIDFRFVQD